MFPIDALAAKLNSPCVVQMRLVANRAGVSLFAAVEICERCGSPIRIIRSN